MKTYDIHVQFDVQYMQVKAKNQKDAERKVKEKLKKIPSYKFMDKRNFFITKL